MVLLSLAQVKEAAQGTYQRAREVDEEHKVVDKAKAGASRAWIRAKEVRVVPTLRVLQIELCTSQMPAEEVWVTCRSGRYPRYPLV